ncbi:MAG: hypothetical protein N3A38_07625 [Planctomycetota bacterium]|nr:hypothetical protein [Planctomycetota bacterium]
MIEYGRLSVGDVLRLARDVRGFGRQGDRVRVISCGADDCRVANEGGKVCRFVGVAAAVALERDGAAEVEAGDARR